MTTSNPFNSFAVTQEMPYQQSGHSNPNNPNLSDPKSPVTQQPECNSVGGKAFPNSSKPGDLVQSKMGDNVNAIHLKPNIHDAANCKPNVVRSTLTQIPRNPDVLTMAGIPFAMFFQPFGGNTQTQRVESTIAQCHNPICSAYLHPFTDFPEPDKWRCSFCTTLNCLSETIQHRTKGYPCTIGPEMTSASVDFPTAPSQNGDQLNKQLPIYLYLLDTSPEALATGYLPLFCDTLLAELGRLISFPTARIGFITYDSVVHLYKRGLHSRSPMQQLIVPLENIKQIANDIKGRSTDYLLDVATFYDTISHLLQQLPLLYPQPPCYQTQETGTSALGAALTIGFGLTRSPGGRITVVQASRPNVEPRILDETTKKKPSFLEKWGFSYSTIQKPANTFYQSMGIKCCQYFVSVDLFLLGGQNMNLTNLMDVAKLSGGNSYQFLDFNRNDSRHSKRFEETLRRYLSREIGWNTSFEQKVHPGFKVVRFFGNHSHDPDERQRTDLPVVHPDTNFGFELSLDENIPVNVERVCFQVALHYTTPIGQNRTRIHTVAVPVTDSLLAVAKSVDQQCLAAYLTKLTAEELLASKKQSQDVIYQHLKHKCDNVSASYRYALALLSLMTPYNNRRSDDSSGAMKDLKSLLLCVTSVLQSVTYQLKNRSTDDCVSILEQWRVLPVSQLISFLLSRLYEVSNKKTIRLLDARWEVLESSNAYLLDTEKVIFLIIGRNVNYSFLTDVFGVLNYDEVPDELTELPMLLTQRSNTLRCFVGQLQSQKRHLALFRVVKEESSITEQLKNLLLNFNQ